LSLATAARPDEAREPAVAANPEPPRTHYRPDIDGIRGTAAIMVMGYHAHVPGFDGGYIGLDLFFVVSGFVIAGLLLGEFGRTGRIRWSAFYARRARRLIPAKVTMLVGVLILSYFVMAPMGAQQETARSAAAAAAFVSNFFFWQVAEVDYFATSPGTGALLHTWSLSVEEQFYLALPLCIFLAWGLARLLRIPVPRALLMTTLALALASVWAAVTIADSSPTAAYYLPITRAFEFLIGVLLAVVVTRVDVPALVRQVMGLVGGLLVIYLLWQPMPTDTYPGYWALLPCGAATLMIWAGTGSSTAISHVLAIRVFVGLGLVSYGWYLWHWPLLVFGESMNLAPPPLWARIALVMLALGVAVLSYRYIEAIFYRRSGHRSSARTYGGPRVVLSGVTTMAIVIASAGGAFLIANETSESSKWQEVNQQLRDRPRIPRSCLGDARLIPDRPVACELVPFKEHRPTVVLWGDSHAWMFIPALREAVRSQDVRVNLVVFTQGSCPPFLNVSDSSLPCAQGNDLALDYVTDLTERDLPVRVILGASWQAYFEAEPLTLREERNLATGHLRYVGQISELFDDGAPRLFDELGKLGAGVDVIAPTAVIGRIAPLCEAGLHPYSCNRPRTQALRNEERTRAWLDDQMAKLSGTPRLIDVTDEMCDEETCFATSEDGVNYFDDRHISASFSGQLEEYFEETVRSAFPPRVRARY
jgi:peptidoglycan/LPS O-acetylase OafA/YrhL